MHCYKSSAPKKYYIILVVSLIFFSLIANIFGVITVAENNENKPPFANGGNVTSVECGDTVYFSALGSKDLDGEIVRYEWDFEGDGIYDWNNTKNGTTKRIYEKPMAYNATLRVTDNDGATDTDVYYVLVLSPENEEKEIDPKVKNILISIGIVEIIFGAVLLVSMFKLKKDEEK